MGAAGRAPVAAATRPRWGRCLWRSGHHRRRWEGGGAGNLTGAAAAAAAARDAAPRRGGRLYKRHRGVGDAWR